MEWTKRGNFSAPKMLRAPGEPILFLERVLSRFAANRCLAAIRPKAYSTAMSKSEKLDLDRARRVDLARKAFKEYFALCFWSSNPNMEIHEEHIPFVIRGLRHYGGDRSFSVVRLVLRSGP